MLSALVAGHALAATEAQWQEVVPQTLFAEKLRIAAFLNEDLGITGGAGDIGKASATSDGGKTWSYRSLGLDKPGIMGFVSEGFVNEIPQTAVRFVDADNGLVVLGLSGKAGMIALHTADGGKTWKEKSLPTKFFGAPYISRDGKFVTVNKWGEGTTLLKYE